MSTPPYGAGQPNPWQPQGHEGTPPPQPGWQQASGYPQQGYPPQPGYAQQPAYPPPAYPGWAWGGPPLPDQLPLPAGEGYVYWPAIGAVPVPSMGRRLLARSLDGAIMLLVLTVLGVTLGATLGALAPAGPTPVWVPVVGVTGGVLLILGLPALYEFGLIATRGATIGKQALGIRVVRSVDAGLPGWGKAFGRWFLLVGLGFVPFFGGLAVLLFCLSPLFDSSGRRQGWHDMGVGTVVIAAR